MKNEHAKEFVAPAIAYLQEERNKKRSDRHQSAVCAAVAEKLIEFCRQDAEFAQAVEQKKSFDGCLAAVVKGVGGCLSDIEAYSRAASYYFNGAKIKCVMTIDLIGDAAASEDAQPETEKTQKPKRLELSLLDIL